MTSNNTIIDDRYFLELADRESTFSHDLSTRIGAVIVQGHGIVARGFNDIPHQVGDTPERRERPAKYVWTEHAERAAIFNAAKYGNSLLGTTMYTQGIPCADCARAVIMSGIARVVVWKKGTGLEETSRWTDSIQAGKTMLEEAGVEIVGVERG